MLAGFSKSWLSGETVTPDKLNTNMSDTLRGLHSKNIAIVRNLTTNPLYLNSNANAFVGFTRPMRVSISIPQGAAVKIGFANTLSCSAFVTGTTGTAVAFLDILIDGEIYLSSLAASPTTDGLYKNSRVLAAGAPYYLQGRGTWFLTQLDEGVHTFELVGKSVAVGGDRTFYINLEPNFFFWVEQYGQNIGQLIGANNT